MNALAQIHPPFTTDEFRRMVDRGAFGDLRVELRRGMILKMSPQYFPHADVKDRLLDALKTGIAACALNWRAISEVSVECGDGFEPMPDIVLLDLELFTFGRGPAPSAAVMLVVEVADTTLKDDLGAKRDEYAEAGLPEYWVADVKGGRIVRHADPVDGAYRRVDEVPMAGAVAMLTEPRLTIAAI